MYAVVGFLLLWCHCQLTLCERCWVEEPDSKTLYILSPKNNSDEMQKVVDNIRYKMIYSDPIKDIAILNNCSSKLMESPLITQNLTYAAHLKITDFYKTNYNEVRKNNLVWAGDYGNESTVDVCKIHKVETSDVHKTCEEAQEYQYDYTKLVSKAVEETSAIYDIFYEYPGQPNRRPNRQYKIIVCSEQNISPQNEENRFYSVEIKTANNDIQCKQIVQQHNDALVILAPEPTWIDETDKLVIFNEVTSTDRLRDYINAIPQRSLEKLALAVFELIKRKWTRVAILSDGSEDSVGFEKEMRILFEDNQVSYTVRSVAEQSRRYDFKGALASLRSVDARIIIGNVDQKHAETLISQARSSGMANSNILWIVREWSKEESHKAAKIIKNRVLSVIPSLPSIEENLKEIMNVLLWPSYEEYESNEVYVKRKNDIDYMRPYLETRRSPTFNFLRITKRREDIVATYTTSLRVNTNYLRSLPDDRGDCIFKSDNFDRPCDDIVVVFLTLVICVLSITILAITHFFDMPDMIYSRMR